MSSLESINELLKDAAEKLNQAAMEINEVKFEPEQRHNRSIGIALSYIYLIVHRLHDERPDLMTDYDKRLRDYKSDKDIK